MQLWKFNYLLRFIWKQYPENFAFLILKILELFNSEVVYILAYPIVSVCLQRNI